MPNSSKKQALLKYLILHGFSKEILKAFSEVKREKFIPKELRHLSYADIALPIGENQTISQPYTIAEMLSLLDIKPRQKILEIGSGSGYCLALINKITKGKTYGIEIIKSLAKKSKENLKSYPNAKVFNKNASSGLKEFAPFDRILISAAIKKIPPALANQLKENSLLVAPIDSKTGSQTLTLFEKQKNKLIIKKEIPGFVFVRFV